MKHVLLTGFFCFLLFEFYAQTPVGAGTNLNILNNTTAFTDLNVTATPAGKVILSWKLLEQDVDFFVIERSNNEKDFEVLAVTKLKPAGSQYQWIDDAPGKGKLYYRIRFTNSKNQLIYSKIVFISLMADSAFRFYPNPVDNMLIIRSDQPVEVQISDGTGKVRLHEPRVQGLYVLNTSTLEKGVYILTVINKQAILIVKEKLLKN